MCQQDEWIEGKLSAAAGLKFVPDRPKFLALRYPGVAAQACGSCGHARLSVDVELLESASKE
jgi:hypothetical protein